MITFTAYDRTFTAEPEFGRYPNGRLAIRMVDPEDGSPVCTLTVNMVHEGIAPKDVFIKDWAENEPIALALLEAGLIKYTGREVQAGFAIAHEATLEGALLDAFNNWTF